MIGSLQFASLCCLSALITFVPSAVARDRVSINGSVVDASGAPVPGALVMLQRTRQELDIVCRDKACDKGSEGEIRFENHEDQKLFFTYSDATGKYLAKVPVGKGFGIVPRYLVSVMASGYRPLCEAVGLPENGQKSVTHKSSLKRVERVLSGSKESGKLKIKVFDQSGAVFPGLQVLTRLNSDPISPPNKLEKDGRLRTGETTPIGELEIELTAGAYDVVLPTVGVCGEAIVSSGKTTDLTYKIQPF